MLASSCFLWSNCPFWLRPLLLRSSTSLLNPASAAPSLLAEKAQRLLSTAETPSKGIPNLRFWIP